MRAVLIPIADAANRDGDHAHPGKEGIIEGSLYKRSTVTDAIKRLIVERWIEVEEWSCGRGQATVYRVLMDRPPSTPEPVTERPKTPNSAPEKGANRRPLPARKAAAPAMAASQPERGHDERRKGPAMTAKGASVPTWIGTPTVDLSTETLPTGGATDPANSSGGLPLDVRAGVGLETQETPTPDLLAAIAAAAPPACRYQLLEDPEQAPGRAALRHRLDALATAIGPDAAVTVVAGEWPAAVASPMAHANARARSALAGSPSPASWKPAPADPLDGITDAAAAIAERARARQLEAADEPALVPPPAWKDELRRRLYPTDVSS